MIQGEGNFSGPMADNGLFNANSLLNSEKAVQELIERSPLMETDDHLIEFSEALRSMYYSFISYGLPNHELLLNIFLYVYVILLIWLLLCMNWSKYAAYVISSIFSCCKSITKGS